MQRKSRLSPVQIVDLHLAQRGKLRLERGNPL